MDLLYEIKKVWTEHIVRRKVGFVQIPEESDPFEYHYGTVSLSKPINGIKKGENLLTPDGIGECHISFPWRGPAAMQRQRVEVWLRRKYYKAYLVDDVYQYMIYHEPLDRHLPLSNSSYRYILEPGDVVKYRITSRGYAMLADSEKEEREWIKLFNDRRGGRTLLKHLLSKGYVITKD